MTKRWVIYGLITALCVLLAAVAAQLPQDLRQLVTAQSDNSRWTILQVDTEFANLRALLADEVQADVPDSDALKLRASIALSRADLIMNGRTRELLGTNPSVDGWLADLSDYAAQTAEIIDRSGDLSPRDVETLRQLADEVRPAVRELVLLGLARETAIADQQRGEFASKLRRIGILAIAVVTCLAIGLLYLDQLLGRTRRKDAELRASTERLKATVAASLDGIVIANSKGQIIDFNSAASEIFGWARDDIIGLEMDETIVPHQHRNAHKAGMTRYLATHEPHVVDAGRIELTALRKTGEEFPIELNITSAEGDEDEIFIAYVRDISERKVTEKKLIDARETAERTDRAKSSFLTVMSHEMRTPLNGILGVLDLLKTTDLDPKQARYAQVAAASGEILLEHVNEALDITRIETGVMSLTPEVFSLRATVYRVVDVLRTLAEEKGLTLKVDFDPAMDRSFFADGVRINQILTNVIGNAIKFTETGSILVSVNGIHGTLKTDVAISVTDTGPGIEQARLEDIFEDFVALAQSSGRQRRGDGLGLSISRRVARLMDGDLTVESNVESGSTFTLNLPLQRSETSRPSRPLAIPEAQTSRRRILIVEDNAINRSVLKDMLAGFGHDVIEAENGLEGLKRAEDDPFDLIIMDISMPFMDGIEATRRIREGNSPNQSTYILGLTAHGRQEFRMRAEAAGMDDFCTKPVRLSELRARLDGITPVPKKTQVASALSDEVLEDLHAALGDETMTATVDRFFAELDDTLQHLRSRSPATEAAAISESLHKLRGAAVVLGLTDLTVDLDKCGEAITAENLDLYQFCLNRVATTGKSAFAAIMDWLAAQKG